MLDAIDRNFLSPFADIAFMQRALMAGVLVSIACAVVGTYVVLRGMAFIGDALAHGVLPGVAAATLLGVPGWLGAATGAAVMIGGVGLVTARSRLSNDTAIGLLFVGMLALGVVIVSASDAFTGDLIDILFGELLGVSADQLWVQAGATLVVVVAGVLGARAFLLLSIDPDLCEVSGFRARRTERLLLVLVAATVVVSFQTVGTLLVFGMLLAPAGTGALMARRVGSMMTVSAVVGCGSTYLGLLASYHLDTAAGASVVLVAVLAFFVTLAVSQVGGSRRIRRAAAR